MIATLMAPDYSGVPAGIARELRASAASVKLCRMPALILWPLAVVFLLFLAVSVLLYNAVQMTSLLLLPISPGAFRFVNRSCAGLWFSSLALVLEKGLGVKFIQTGDSLPKRENAFVVANHQSGADIPALVVLAFRCRRARDLKWFVKDVIKWIPGIGWGMLFLDCLFVKRNWSADKEKILATFDRLRTHQVPFWILSFAEGTRLTPAKLKRSQEFERKARLPVLNQVMSPRTKGFEATLEGLGGMVDAVYDITLGYENFPVGEVPGAMALFFGGIRRVHLHVKRYPMGTLPLNREGRGQWISERFTEKNARLEDFRKSGRLG
ncbi:MAG TPA: lysophospholipid acyltransferase family protein [Bdellovibrionota bacterium]|jgi:1-acyl-sn-glycerol-3-phosphate acyltransferase